MMDQDADRAVDMYPALFGDRISHPDYMQRTPDFWKCHFLSFIQQVAGLWWKSRVMFRVHVKYARDAK